MQVNTFLAVQTLQPTQQSLEQPAPPINHIPPLSHIMHTPLAGLVGLPMLAITLAVIFRSSHRLSFAIFNNLHSQYQAYRMAIRLQQVDRLERIFSTSPSSSERG